MTSVPLNVLAQTLYRPPLGLGVLVLVIAIALVMLVLSAGNERAYRTASLRIAALAGLAWLLMGPSVVRPGKPSIVDPPRLAILTDTSLSMAERDVVKPGSDQSTTRLDAVTSTWLSQDQMTELRRIAQVDEYEFDGQLRIAGRTTPKAKGDATRLYDAVSQVKADATLILSDGNDTTASASPPDAPSAGRLFASPIGTPRSAPDLAIDAWPDSDLLFDGQSTTVSTTIRQRGFMGTTVVVELEHNGELIQSETITLDQPSSVVRFQIKPKLESGKSVQAEHYRARVRLAQGDEAYTDNNRQDLFVQVSRGKVRVLLLEGEPYWDTRSLSRLIGLHPRFDLTAVFGFGDQRQSRVLGESYEPGSDPAQLLDYFDIVVLGRRVNRLVDPGFGDRLTRYVRKGGAVVFARGNAFDSTNSTGRQLTQSVDAISPGIWGDSVVSDMRIRLNEQAIAADAITQLSDQAVISRLPGMLAATRIEGRKAASVVLLEQQSDAGPPMAALTTMRVGSGQTLTVLTEGLWRWELLPGVDEDTQAQTAYAAFWVRALQWLASGGEFLPGQDIALQADRMTMDINEPVTVEVNTRYIEQDGLNLELIAVDEKGAREPISLSPTAFPSRYKAAYTPSATGVVRFELTAQGRDDLIRSDEPLTTRVAVVHRSPERRDTSAQPQLLKQMTEATGGRCLELDEPGPLLDYLQSLQAARGTQDTAAYAFNTWPAFVWVVGCFGLEWVLRRRGGLR